MPRRFSRLIIIIIETEMEYEARSAKDAVCVEREQKIAPSKFNTKREQPITFCVQYCPFFDGQGEILGCHRSNVTI